MIITTFDEEWFPLWRHEAYGLEDMGRGVRWACYIGENVAVAVWLMAHVTSTRIDD